MNLPHTVPVRNTRLSSFVVVFTFRASRLILIQEITKTGVTWICLSSTTFRANVTSVLRRAIQISALLRRCRLQKVGVLSGVSYFCSGKSNINHFKKEVHYFQPIKPICLVLSMNGVWLATVFGNFQLSQKKITKEFNPYHILLTNLAMYFFHRLVRMHGEPEEHHATPLYDLSP